SFKTLSSQPTSVGRHLHGKRLGSKHRTANNEHRIPKGVLPIWRWEFDVRCSMFASTLDARFYIDEGCAIGPTWETAGRCGGFTSRYRRVRSPGPHRSLRDLSFRRALSRWHLSHWFLTRYSRARSSGACGNG